MGDPLKLLDRLKTERDVIKGAPFSFAGACATIAILCSAIFWWHYGGTIHQKDASNSAKDDQIRALEEQSRSKDERMKLKDELVSYYRERYGILPGTNQFASLRNAELKEKTIQFVRSLREFQKRMQVDEIGLFESMTTNRDRLQSQVQAEFMRHHLPLMQEYESDFRADAIMLVDELLTRTKRENQPKIYRASFERIVVSFNVPDVCDPLEKMAMALPDAN